MIQRYEVRENGQGAYGVFDTYLSMWVEHTLSEYDAEVVVMQDAPGMYDEPDYGIGLR